jgi:arylsulfatase A-like enzyme
VHYVEPHSPYVLHRAHLKQLGLSGWRATFSPNRRYDTEIAYVDHCIGRLLEQAAELVDFSTTPIIFSADHGESLGHHGYWGHGRHVYEASLHIPLAISWPGHIEPAMIDSPALLGDLAATVMGLAGIAVPDFLTGFDWSPVLLDGVSPPPGRVTYHQGHRGAVKPDEDRSRVRRRGLLEVGRIEAKRKEVLVVRRNERRVFDLEQDRAETNSLVPPTSKPSDELRAWLREVQAGLERSDELPPPSLDEETLERLRALGYLDERE